MIESLRARPADFEFFQAVRLLEEHAREVSPEATSPGFDSVPGREFVRLRVGPALGFPEGELAALHAGEDGRPAELTVVFLGLIGVAGALPVHYTELVLDRGHERDRSLRDWLDLFHHRALSLFFRAWKKYKVPFEFESAAATGREDLFSALLLSLTGFGTPGVRRRLAVDERALAFHAGQLSRGVRSAGALEALLSDLLGMPFRVEQFVGQWLEVPIEERSRLGAAQSGEAAGALGSGFMLGSRVWDVRSKIRVHAGPLEYEQFERVRPRTAGQACLRDLLRTYLGTGTDFELVVELASSAAPAVRLGSSQADGSRLGHDGWLGQARTGHGPARAVFCLDRS